MSHTQENGHSWSTRLSSHGQISWLFPPTFPVKIYGVSTLATVAIQNEMMLFLTAIFSRNYDNYGLYAKLYPVKDSLLAHFMSWTIHAATDHTQQHIFPTFPWPLLTSLTFQIFHVNGHPAKSSRGWTHFSVTLTGLDAGLEPGFPTLQTTPLPISHKLLLGKIHSNNQDQQSQ